MYKRKIIKPAVILASGALITCISVGGSLAYIVASDDPVSTVFTPSEIETVIDYTLYENGGSYSVKSESNVDVLVRVSLSAEWITADGFVYDQPVTEYDYSVVYDPALWTQVGGHYFCTYPLAPAESTAYISVMQASDAPEGCTLNVAVDVEIIQASDDSIADSGWGYVPALN